MFVTSVVAGSVFLTKSFSLMVRPFLRDIAFYLVAIVWTFALFFTERSYLYHGIGKQTIPIQMLQKYSFLTEVETLFYRFAGTKLSNFC